VLRKKEGEREACLSNYPIEVELYQRVKIAVIITHGVDCDSTFDESIGAANEIERLLWYTVRSLLYTMVTKSHL